MAAVERYPQELDFKNPPIHNFGIVRFPGTNCEKETLDAVVKVGKQKGEILWHKGSNVSGFDRIILPGGFAYGDYLRTGAIARFSEIMDEVSKKAKENVPVLGICNGFQIQCEAGLLPGAFLKNNVNQFRCEWVYIRTERNDTPFSVALNKGDVLKLPIAHGEGNYYADSNDLKKIEKNGQVLFRYCDASGNVSDRTNPNGSVNNIAGILNERFNVLGMMPHPERACDNLVGSSDGKGIFQSLAL